VPALYDAALRRPDWLLPLEHLTYLLAGCLLWWPVLQPRSRFAGAGPRALYVFAAFVLSAPLGVLLALVPEPIYEAYADAPERVFGLSRLADQQLGGVTMAGEQSALFFVVFAILFLRFLEAEDAHDL
jgi:cytochrome c oxidase assembly factor CtaG